VNAKTGILTNIVNYSVNFATKYHIMLEPVDVDDVVAVQVSDVPPNKQTKICSSLTDFLDLITGMLLN
jgi:hypothetical protein